MKIGMIGLGLMGAPMAANLLKAGFALNVFDLKKENAASLRGATWSESPAAGVDVVLTSLPGPPEVEAVSEKILKDAKPGTAWIDLSTNSPEVVRRIYSKVKARDIAFLDAPVSGGPGGANSGKLAIWVGGDKAAYERCLPVLKALGDQPFYVGPIGAGSVAKLVHNASTFTVQTALAETFTLGVKAGVDPLALYQAIRHGASGRARTFDRLAEKFLPGTYDPAGFALRLAHKDVTLALELAKSLGVPMKAGEHALAELSEAMRRGWGERDCRASMLLQEERAGVSVHVPPEKLKGIT
jgi:3-hydroxyisobutyrate dehydrogenase